MPSGTTGLTRAVAAAVLFASAACADAPEPLSLERQPLASTAVAEPQMLAGFFHDPQGNGVSCDSGEAMPADIQSAAWIDERGGEVRITGFDAADRPIAHVLVVPANTVTRRTLFCMQLDASNHMAVQLSALAHAEDGSVIDIGKYGLPRPVSLLMSYSTARSEVLGIRRVVIVSTSGPVERIEQVAAAVQFSGYAHARVQRLSKYALALD